MFEQEVKEVEQQSEKRKPVVMKWLFFIILGIAFIYVAVNQIEKSRNYPDMDKLVKHYTDSVDKSYDKIIKDARDSIKTSIQRESVYVDSINSLITQVQKNNNYIDQLENDTHEKVIYVSKLSTDDLAKFFTDRYGNK